MKQALVVWGGWDGHQPEEVAAILGNVLKEEGFAVDISDTLDSFKDSERLESVDLIVPVWTMGTIQSDQLSSLIHAVKVGGTGLAGCHGGLGDSFRNETEFQYMVGGQWVAHPGNDGVSYEVKMKDLNHPLTQGIDDFTVVSEQYYMHTDPANQVHVVTYFGDVEMPVVWTKMYGSGKVYYCSLGHQADIVSMPETLELMRRGMLWAAR
ncbi:ThuA domain-containing protein [Paenibacillus eucommiae]|uniref:Type 1 glutamine amidotransferase n=1 Tax=Paenibacillus eucommiae TaxID=1355755 RepID=A0ABS4IZJ6_9BACL|nr:ThuA domain-containing protein [Paenibacillus eucommiae]MBP1992970.1 type 1 glutamine amidotransferase [Paenibacillus eucommiae]